MKSNGGNQRNSCGPKLALVASLLAGFGCGPVGTESIAQEEQAAVTSITTWSQLQAITFDGNYRLDASLDASGKSWTPISFNGTFDGNNKTISNLKLNMGGDVGFFQSPNVWRARSKP